VRTLTKKKSIGEGGLNRRRDKLEARGRRIGGDTGRMLTRTDAIYAI